MSVTQSGRAKTAMHTAHETEPLPAQAPVPPNWGSKRRIWVMPLILIAAAVPLGFGWKMLMSDNAQASDSLVFFTVRRGTLPITVTERGNLESQNTEEIICEVENFGGDRSGTTGTQILYIIPNGKSVEKGELLVELDAAPLQERLDSQFLALQRAEAEMIQAKSKYENQETQNQTNLAEAELQVELAKISQKSYEDETGGTFQIELQNIEMEIQTVRAQQMISKADRDAIEELHKLGYKSKGDLDAAHLDMLKANSNLASQLARARQLQEYTYKMEKLERQGRLETAIRSMTQVERNNESELAQAEAARDSAVSAYEKESERFERYKDQLNKCKIYAPQSGMVAYAMNNDRRGGGSVIEEGAFIRQRQEILTIPDLSSMQVNTAVHESVLDQVNPGLKAAIRVDAFSDRSYQGTVKTVAVLPDQGGWMSSDTKVYKTIVTIDESVEQLKPGMTAVIEIDIETLRDVLSVPIQAIIQRGKVNWCYVNVQGKVERREVKLGKTNEKFVEVKEGLTDGDIVVLNPMSLVDEEEAKAKKKGASDEEEAAENEDDAGADNAVQGDAVQDDAVQDDAVQDDAVQDDSQQDGKRGGPGAGRGGGAEGRPGADDGGPVSAEEEPRAVGTDNARAKKRPGGKRGGFDLKSFDQNEDGQITKDELPEGMSGMFERLDKNGDGVIEASEFPSMPRKQ